MRKPLLMILSVVLILVSQACKKNDDVKPNNVSKPEVGIAGDGNLSANMDYIIKKYEIPGIAFITLKSGQTLEQMEKGTRIFGQQMSIAENSKWHIGSITKSMTSSLVAILVEKGVLDWETTIGETIEGEYRTEYEEINMIDLLSQTSGVSTQDLIYPHEDDRPLSEIRMHWTLSALNIPQSNKGDFSYSNNNYVIAGAILETITGKTWEDLIIEHLFEPLQMTESGFGAPGRNTTELQPWGHFYDESEWLEISPKDIMSDNPASLGPAGTIHTTLNDMKKYIRFHLGMTNLLSQNSLDILHREVNNSTYALGWNVNEYGFFHAGSNSRWYAMLFVSADGEYACFAVTNSYDLYNGKSQNAVQELMGIVGERYANTL